MPRVKNRSWSPLTLALGDDRRIAMAARGFSEISNEDAESPEVQRLIADGSLIVLPERAVESGERPSRKPGRGSGGATTEAGGGQG